MKKTEARRRDIIEKLADHLLAQGLRRSSLRPLAAAAGMSDRMLLHYFKDKDELLTAALLTVTGRLLAILESARPEPMRFEALMMQLAAMMKNPAIRPYLRIYLELAALAAGGEKTPRSIGRRIYGGFFDWVAASLKVEREEERAPTASAAFAMMEGLVLLDAFGLGAKTAAALEGLALIRGKAEKRG